MKILLVVFEGSRYSSDSIEMRIEPQQTLDSDDVSHLGIPKQNHGYFLSKLEDVMRRKGLEDNKKISPLYFKGNVVASIKIYDIPSDRKQEVVRALASVVSDCHNSKEWPDDAVIAVVDRTKLRREYTVKDTV